VILGLFTRENDRKHTVGVERGSAVVAGAKEVAVNGKIFKI